VTAAGAKDVAQVFQRFALAPHRDHAAGAHRGCEHHRARAEIARRAIDQNGFAAANTRALQSAERHDQLREPDQFSRGLVVHVKQRGHAGRGPVRDLGERAVAPAHLHCERGRRGEGRGQADQYLRRIGIGHVAAQMRTQKDPVARPHMADVLAGRDHAADRIGAGHERHRRQAVRHPARQHAAHIGQHHAGLDVYQYAIGRGFWRLDVVKAQIIVRVQPPGFMGICHRNHSTVVPAKRSASRDP